MITRKRKSRIITALACRPVLESLESRMLMAVTYTTSWLGNDFGTGETHIMQNITDVAVTSDGKVVAATHWDEGGTNVAVFQNGAMIGRGLDSGTGSFGRGSAGIVAAADDHFYLAMTQGGGYGGVPDGQSQQQIKRYNYNGTPAGFTNGISYDNSVLNVVTSADSGGKPVVGLVVSNNELYAADSYTNTIRVYQLPLASQSVSRLWSVSRPGRLEVDSAGYIWMLQPSDASNPARLVRYSTTGVLQNQQIIIPSAIAAIDFAIDRVNNRILLTNNGVDQNIVIYTNITTTPTLSSTFGTTGGIFSGTPGAVGPLKLTHPGGVGIDSAGNVYVSNIGVGLEAYTPAGTRSWELLSTLFVDTVAAVPGAETVVYGAQERFAMDYSKTTPGTEWSYQGYTLNPFKYPDDPRLHLNSGSVFTAVIGGKTFLYMTGMFADPLAVYRFNAATDGEVAIPAGLFAGSGVRTSWLPNQPKGEWVWNDLNGNGAFDTGEYSQPANPQTDTNNYAKYVDSRGTVWGVNSANGKIRSFPTQGLNANGTPIYNYNNVQETSLPSDLTQVNYLMYDADTDVMFLTGYTVAYPAPGGYGGGVTGHALMRINDWSSGNRTPAWTVEVPMDLAINQFSKSITSAGDYLFSVECRGNNLVTVFSKATGAQVATLLPGASIGGQQGWVDIPYGISATRRADGEYIIFVEDDWALKNVMYRMNDGLAVKAATPSFSLSPGTYDGTQTVAISSATSGATIRYTIDGTIPTATTGIVYTGPITLSSPATLKAIAYKSGVADSNVASGHYLINTQVALPTFNPAANTYSTSLKVSIISSTAGATIRYTTDGATPTATTGTVYTGPVDISASATLKAIAIRSGMADSAVATVAYTISSAELRLTPTGGDAALFNGSTVSALDRSLPATYNLTFPATVQVDRLKVWMPSTWGGPVNITFEIKGGLTADNISTIVAPTVYSIAGWAPVEVIIPATNLQYLQLVVTVSHNGRGSLSEVEVYGHNVQVVAEPTGLTATVASSSQINLAWTDKSTDETGFSIDRATDSAFTTNRVTNSVGANVTSYQATGLTAATTYYFRVHATGALSDSPTTPAVTATTLASIPAVPSALRATAGSSNHVNLAWTDNSNNETGFVIDVATNITFTQNLSTVSVGANVTTYLASGLTASTTYYFRVRATNSAGDSANSATASVATQAPALPAAPSGLTASAVSSSQINLSWTDNSNNETGFIIDRATDSGFTSNLISSTVGANVTSYQATELAEVTAYYFRVRATNVTGDSANTSSASAATLLGAPRAPMGLTATVVSDSRIGLLWVDTSNTETAFVIDRATNSTFTGNLVSTTVGANVTTYQATGLAELTTYYFRVRATNAAGASANTTAASATTLRAPLTPTGGDAFLFNGNTAEWPQKSLPHTYNLSFDHPVVVDSLKVWMPSTWGLAQITFEVRGGMTPATITTLVASSVYNIGGGSPVLVSVAPTTLQYLQIVVTATHNNRGNVSELQVYGTDLLITPTDLSATGISPSQINLAWTDNSNNETGFKIERATDIGFTQNMTLVTTTAANATSYSNTGLAANTTYYYRVRATNVAGDSANSNSAGPVMPVLQINGDQGSAGQNDQIRVARNATDSSLLDVFLNSVTPTYSVNFAALNTLVINGLGGDDTLTLDLANGPVIPTGGISYDGGLQTAGDTMIIAGSSADDAVTFTANQVTIGAGVVTLAGVENRSFKGGAGNDSLALGAGSYTFTSDMGLDTTRLSLTLADGAQVVFSGVQHLGGLTLTGSAKVTLADGGRSTLVVQSLSLGAASSLDVADNAVIVDYSGSTPLAAIYPLIAGAAANRWAGTGIVSHTAAAGGSQYALGVADNITTGLASFAGQTVDGTSVLIRLTYSGDANLDGQVDLTDLTILAGSWQMAERQWGQGDADYSGLVDLTDLTILAGNWQKVLPTPVAAAVVSLATNPAVVSPPVDAAPAVPDAVVVVVVAGPTQVDTAPTQTTSAATPMTSSTTFEISKVAVAPLTKVTQVAQPAAAAPVAPMVIASVRKHRARVAAARALPVTVSPVPADRRPADIFSNRPLAVAGGLISWPVTRQEPQTMLWDAARRGDDAQLLK